MQTRRGERPWGSGDDEERLMRECAAGDPAAATVVLARARRRGDGPGEVLGWLALCEPGERGWRRVCEALAHTAPTEAYDARRTLALCERLLEARWQGVERLAPQAWLEAAWMTHASPLAPPPPPWLGWCNALVVRNCASAEQLATLRAAASWHELESLVLEGCAWLAGDGELLAASLADWLALPRLQRLALRDVSLSGCLSALTRLRGLATLSSLALVGCGLQATDLVPLLACNGLSGLRELSLRDNALGDEGLDVLSRAPTLAQLESLELTSNAVGDPGMTALTAPTSTLVRLRRLILDDNEISNAGAAILAAAPLAASLAELELAGNDLDVYGCNALSASPHLPPALRMRAHDWERRLDETELLEVLADEFDFTTELSLSDNLAIDLVEQAAAWEFELDRHRDDEHWQEVRACERVRRRCERAQVDACRLGLEWYDDQSDCDDWGPLDDEPEDDEDGLVEQSRLRARSIEEWRWWDDPDWLWQQAADLASAADDQDDDDDEPTEGADAAWLFSASTAWCERLTRSRLS